MPRTRATPASRRPRVFALLGVGMLTAAALAAGVVLADSRSSAPQPRRSDAALPTLAPNPNAIAFLGDSITYGFDLDVAFSGVDAVNLGVSGDTTADVLARMPREILALRPAKAVVMIGTNDLGQGRTAAEVLEGVARILDRIRSGSPATEIVLESLYPVHERPNEAFDTFAPGRRTNARITRVNDGLAALAAARQLTFVDVYAHLIDDDGQLAVAFTYDGLHLTPEGYAAVAEVLAPAVLDAPVLDAPAAARPDGDFTAFGR